MGQDVGQLEAVFESIYRSRKPLSAKGHYKAEVGEGLLSKLIGFMTGIPIHKEFRPATLTIDRKEKHDVWKRNFGGRKFSSKFYDAGEFKVEQAAFLKFYFKITFAKSVYYDCVRTSLGMPFKIISNNHPVSDNEWDFEVIIRSRKNSALIFRYWGRMRIEKD